MLNVLSSFKRLKNAGLLFVAALALVGCATPQARYMEAHTNVISVSPAQTKSFSVGEVSIGKTPGSIGVPVILKKEELSRVLAKNFENYNLLAADQDSGSYTVGLDITFEYSGLWDLVVRGIGTYEITNVKTGDGLTVEIDEAYTADMNSDMFWSGLGRAAAGATVGALVGNQFGGTNTTAIGAIVGGSLASGKGEVLYEPVELSDADREALYQSGYAPAGIPITARDGVRRMEHAYEGSIRLNIAMFMEKLSTLKLP